MAQTKPKAGSEAGPEAENVMTGVKSLYDVVRHLLTHGPARNDAERAELLGVVNASDPDYTEPEHVMTAAEKAAEYDRLQAAKPADASTTRGEAR